MEKNQGSDNLVIEEEYENEETVPEWEGIDAYFNLANNFIPHLFQAEQKTSGNFQIIPFPTENVVLQATTEFYESGDILDICNIPTL